VMLEAKSNPKGVVAWLGSGGRRWERARWRWLARRWLARRWLGGPRLRGCLVAVERELRPAGAEQLFGGHRESKSAPIGRDMSQIDIAADALLRHGVRYIDTHRQRACGGGHDLDGRQRLSAAHGRSRACVDATWPEPGSQIADKPRRESPIEARHLHQDPRPPDTAGGLIRFPDGIAGTEQDRSGHQQGGPAAQGAPH